MKNRKGFTLVELLAVILILGVLLLIAIPSVTKYLNRGTTKYYVSLEDTMIVSGREYLTDYRALLPKEIGNVTVVPLNELVNNHYIDEVVDNNGNICDGKMIAKKVEKNKYEYYSCLQCETYQTLGENCNYSEDENITPETKNYTVKVEKDNYIINQGETFELPLGKAYYLGELVSSNVSGSPKVIDTNKLGTTKVTYAYKGAKKQITVTVVDNMKPSRPQVVLKLENTTGNRYSGSWYSGNIYVEFKSTDYTKNNLIGSGIDYYEISKDEVTWTKLTSNNITVTENGNENYFVRSVDKSGNISEINTYNIKIDKEEPECTIAVDGTLGKNEWYTSNINLSLDIQTTASGVAIKTVTPDKVTTNTEGTQISGMVTSNSGIVSTCSKTVKVDTKIPETPTITASDNITSGNWHNQDTTLNVSGSSSTSGITYYIDTNSNPTTKQSSTTIFTNTEETTYYAKACNGAGTCSVISSYVLKLDKEQPTAPVITRGNTSWATTSKTISVTTESTVLSNIKNYQYCISTVTTGCNDTWTDLASGVTSVTITTNGINYIYFRAVSNSGVSGIASAYQTTMIDNEGPTIPTSGAIGNVSGSNTTGTIQTAAGGSTDAGVGGIVYKYKITNSNAQPEKTVSGFTTTIKFTRSCGKSYYAWVIAEDSLGNRSEVKSLGSTSDGANSYSGWGSCSASCGGGTQTRTNTCALITTGLSQSCNTQACQQQCSWYCNNQGYDSQGNWVCLGEYVPSC